MTSIITFTATTHSFCGVNSLTVSVTVGFDFGPDRDAGDGDRLEDDELTEATDAEVRARFSDEGPHGETGRDVEVIDE